MKQHEDVIQMGNTATLTIRVDQDIKDRLETVAKHQNRSKAFVTNVAIKEYLAVQEWQEQRIRDAIQSADRGEGVPHNKVLAWVQSWGTDNELPSP